MRRMREANQHRQMALLEENKKMHEQSSLSSKHNKQDTNQKRLPQQFRSATQKSFGEDQDADPALRISGEMKKESLGPFKIFRHKYSGKNRDVNRDFQNLRVALQHHLSKLSDMEDDDNKKKIKLDFEAYSKILPLDQNSAQMLEQNFKKIENNFYGEGIDQIIAFHRMNYKNYVASTLR